MKRLLLALIEGYILFVSPLFKTVLGVSKMCLSKPSCSEFARQAVNRHGIIKGGCLSAIRIFSCQSIVKVSKYGKYF